MDNTYQDQNNELINLINILSFVVGLQNMQENRLQSAHNDVQAANLAQAEYLLNGINRKFDEQNKILAEQNRILAELSKRINGGK